MTCKVSYFFFYMLLYCNWLYSFWWIFYIMENIIVLKMWDSIRISLMLRTKPLKLNCIECHKYYPTTHTFYLMKREKIISFHEVFCLFMMREIYIFFILFYFHYLTTIRQWKYCFWSKFLCWVCTWFLCFQVPRVQKTDLWKLVCAHICMFDSKMNI